MVATQTKHDWSDHNICSILWFDFTFKSCRTSWFSLKWIKDFCGRGVHKNNFCTCVKNYHMNQFLLFKLGTHTYLRTSILVWNITSNTLYLSIYEGCDNYQNLSYRYIFYLFYVFFFCFSVWNVYFHTVRFPYCIQAPVKRTEPKQFFFSSQNWGEKLESFCVRLSTGIKWCSWVDKDKTKL